MQCNGTRPRSFLTQRPIILLVVLQERQTTGGASHPLDGQRAFPKHLAPLDALLGRMEEKVTTWTDSR